MAATMAGTTMTLVVLLSLCAACAVAAPRARSADKIYVHLVPHTHDDVGWLKTVDEYYVGANNSIQHAGVQYILDTVVQELQKNPNRSFIYVEIAYFMRWWNQQTDQTKQIVRDLVTKSKQLEFINAGWCMNDEASTHYNAIIDQMSLGMKFVEQNFGDSARPRIGWHIDPFGHSAEQAALFAKMGLDGFFFARIDYDDKNKRLGSKTMEMVWQPSASLGAESDIFTGVLYSGYGPPSGFCWDVRCSDTPIQDDPNLFDYNVDERVKSFEVACGQQAMHYTTNHIMLTMGSDFQYESAHEWYKNLDKLIHYVNTMSDVVEVFYSTPSRYVDAVHAANKTWTVKTDDFFPYADNPYAYWSGYFTSRPALKGYTRKMNSLLQACKYLEAVGFGANLKRQTMNSSITLQHAMGVDQHHDAVSGTEKQHVADDYAKRLHMGQVACQEVIGEVVASYASSKTSSPPLTGFKFCEYLNISACPGSETDSFNILVWNQIGRETYRVFTVPVMSTNLTVLNSSGKPVNVEFIPVSNATKAVRRDKGNAPYNMIFSDKLPALGGSMFFVRPAMSKVPKVLPEVVPPKTKADMIVQNAAVAVTIDGTTGRLKAIDNKLSNIMASVDQQFLFWNSSAGNNVNSTQASGAYIFRPNGTAPHTISSVAKVTVINGSVVQEVRQVFSPWVSQVVRLYSGFPIVELEYTIGPIPDDDVDTYGGKEVISQFTTDIMNDGVWYTDANGREMQKRTRNYRPTWKLNVTEPVAGNYYPVNSRIYFRDEKKDVQFTVLTDRSQGGSSLNDGQLELMVHRRCFYDDGRGVGEPLSEPGQYGEGLIIRGRHILILDNFINSTGYHRVLGELLMMEPVYSFLPNTESYADFSKKYFTTFTGLTNNLPFNIHFLTLQYLEKNKFLLRLDHQFEANEYPLNNTVTLQLDEMFSDFKVLKATELTLGGNALLSDVHRLTWNTGGSMNPPLSLTKDNLSVELKPMDIRTFNITVQYY